MATKAKPGLKRGEDGLTKYQRYYQRYAFHLTLVNYTYGLHKGTPKSKIKIGNGSANAARSRNLRKLQSRGLAPPILKLRKH